MTTSTHSGPHAVYTGRATNWPMVLLSCAVTVPLVVEARQARGTWSGEASIVLGLVLVGVVVNLLTATSVRTAAGPNGVAIRFGAVGWPRLRYPIGSIATAEVVDLRWWAVAFGFWWTPRRTCCTVRSGPTLRLRLTNGRTVTVSVPDPHAAVAAVAAARAH